MIVTDWAAAREAIVEQRGERLAADIEALLRERELLAEASILRERGEEKPYIDEHWRPGRGVPRRRP